MSQCPVELCLASRINECTLGHFVDHELLELEARVRISTYLSDVYFLGQGTMAMFFLQNIQYYIPWQQHRTSSSRSEVNLPVALGPPAQTCMSSSCELQVRPPERFHRVMNHQFFWVPYFRQTLMVFQFTQCHKQPTEISKCLQGHIVGTWTYQNGSQHLNNFQPSSKSGVIF